MIFGINLLKNKKNNIEYIKIYSSCHQQQQKSMHQLRQNHCLVSFAFSLFSVNVHFDPNCL